MKTIKAIIASLALFAMFAGTSAQAKVEIQWWHAFGGRLGELLDEQVNKFNACLLYTSPSPRDQRGSPMPASA